MGYIRATSFADVGIVLQPLLLATQTDQTNT